MSLIPPIEIDTDQAMCTIAKDIEKQIDKKYGFAVLVFPFGDGGQTAHYISNARREDMIKALREMADVLEERLDISDVRHPVQ